MKNMAQKKNEVNEISQPATYALMLAAAVILAMSIYAGIFKPPTDNDMVGAPIGFAIGIMLGALIVAWQWSKGPVADKIKQRARLVRRAAIVYSWGFSAALIAMLMLINQLKLATLTVNGVLAIMPSGMINSMIFFWFYFSKKEDLK